MQRERLDHWWKPGQSGNPGGRRKGKSMTTQLREALAWRDENGQATSEKIVDILVNVAMAGDVKALTYVFDRIDGKVPEAPSEVADRVTRVEVAVIGPNGASGSPPEAT